MIKLWGRFLCSIGIHKLGETGRYYSGDGPEHLETCCNRCPYVQGIRLAQEPEPIEDIDWE